MSARIGELVSYSILGIVCAWGLVRAIRRDHTWIAATALGVVLSGVLVIGNLNGVTWKGW
jgi:hypothetical protein